MMKLPKIVYLIISLIILLLIILVVKNATTPKHKPDKLPEVSLSPAGSVVLDKEKFIINKTNIISDKFFSIADAVKVTFNQPVSAGEVVVDITPKTEFVLKQGVDQNEIIIEPKRLWSYDREYRITISDQTSSSSGNKLDKIYEFTFKTVKEVSNYGM